GHPPTPLVRHTCDNRACCNPAHLLVGTARDNIHDAMDRGRLRIRERHPSAKLTDQDVRDIRYRFEHRKHTKRDSVDGVTAIARQYGVSHSAISLIVHGKNWKNPDA